MKSDMMPAVQKSGLKTYVTYRVLYGSAASEFRMSMGLNSWAELDEMNPIVKGMGGQAGYEKYLAKIRPMLAMSEYSISNYRPDLSYVPGT
jgi:hypothetical protein